MSDESEQLKNQLANKEKEIEEIKATFSEIKTAYETLNLQFQQKDTEIQALKSQSEMKETQISTISGIIKTKDEFIESLKSTMEMKDDQILALNEIKKSKTEEAEQLKKKIEEVTKNTVDNSIIEEKDKENQELKEEVKLLNIDLKAVDDEVASLNAQIEEFSAKEKEKDENSSGFSGENLKKEDIMNKIIDMLNRSLHNVNITTPSILDLAELQLYDVKGTVNIKASCQIDTTEVEHQELLQEFEALDNISLRNFGENDRWVCLKDSEEMFIAAIGEKDNFLTFFSDDHNHIKLFNSLIMESWLRARKL
ncbi:MAG: hypothetical protein GY870_08015 [archaeon]|nr:hypothetical protein [archaeon]